MSKTAEEYEKLKQVRMNNMMKWTEEDYKIYRSFFKDVLGCDKVPYWDEVQKLKHGIRKLGN